MRIRWRGLELPNQVIRDEQTATDSYCKFIVEPFERGFGTTIGNSLRRVLLSSLEGAAVARVRIKGAAHEFTSLPGVLEDVTDIVLNVKSLAVRMEGEGTHVMKVSRKGKGVLRGADISCDPAIEIVNKNHHLATLTADVEFSMEMVVEKGRGWRGAEENMGSETDVDMFPVDSSFSPVSRVRYRAEDTRVGQRTNYDRLILEIWTNGVIKPEDALVEAAKILRKHLNPFVFYHELGTVQLSDSASGPVVERKMDADLRARLALSIAELELSVRASNCLESARILTLGELVRCTESELLRVRSFGKTSLREVKRKLTEMGLSLGMNIGGDGSGEASSPAIGESGSSAIADSILPPVGSTKMEHPTSSVPMMNADSVRMG